MRRVLLLAWLACAACARLTTQEAALMAAQEVYLEELEKDCSCCEEEAKRIGESFRLLQDSLSQQTAIGAWWQGVIDGFWN